MDLSTMTHDEFLQVLAHAQEQGWVSHIACATHDGVPSSEEEMVVWEEGGDPCEPVIRLWEVDDHVPAAPDLKVIHG